jgi:hypothetical protein
MEGLRMRGLGRRGGSIMREIERDRDFAGD